jgi:hypothetical protein
MSYTDSNEFFVDRVSEREIFRDMLVGAVGHRIMTVRARSGMGKSWLLSVFELVANDLGAVSVKIDLEYHRDLNILDLIRTCSTEIDSEHFTPLHRLLNQDAIPVVVSAGSLSSTGQSTGVTFGSNNEFGAVSIHGDVAGRDIYNNPIIIVGPPDQRQHELQATELFLVALERLATTRPVVLLFDTYEWASRRSDDWEPSHVDQWIRDKLLRRIHKGRLGHTIVVLAGQRLPSLPLELHRLVRTVQLNQLGEADVREYLCDRCGFPPIPDTFFETIYRMSLRGYPRQLGAMKDDWDRGAISAFAHDRL